MGGSGAGNLGAILASRLSSAAHLGLISLRGAPDRLVYQNMGVILILSLLTFGALGVLTHATALILDVPSPGLGTLLTITLLAGMVVTVATSLAAYKVTAYTFDTYDALTTGKEISIPWGTAQKAAEKSLTDLGKDLRGRLLKELDIADVFIGYRVMVIKFFPLPRGDVLEQIKNALGGE